MFPLVSQKYLHQCIHEILNSVVIENLSQCVQLEASMHDYGGEAKLEA